MFGFNWNVATAIARKDLRTYLANPTGYVFLTLFIATTAAAAFQDGFFARNLADLALLNNWMPTILMLFVPAIMMSAWSEERRGGTDELLLTSPVRDGEVIVGKFLGGFGMYAISLVFSLAHVLVLLLLGTPDPGLMFATYLGYLLMGGLFCAVGLLGSMFTPNATVGFILGAVGCAGLVFAGEGVWAAGILGALLLALLASLIYAVVRGDTRGIGIASAAGLFVGIAAWSLFPQVVAGFSSLSASEHFMGLSTGMIRLSDILYFVSGTAVVLYLCSVLLGRRHW